MGVDGNHTLGNTYGNVALMRKAESKGNALASCLAKKLWKSTASGSCDIKALVSDAAFIIKRTGCDAIMSFLPSLLITPLKNAVGKSPAYSGVA